MEKKILGLDLGSTSIGWALIKESDDNRREVIRMGCRIISLDSDEKILLNKGKVLQKIKKDDNSAPCGETIFVINFGGLTCFRNLKNTGCGMKTYCI